MTTREEPASRCRRRRDETDGGHQCDEACDCEEEENCQEEELVPDNSSSQQEFMRVIGLQSSHRVKARLSCTQEALEQELEDGECEASVGDESMEETSVCSGDSENECPDMLAIGVSDIMSNNSSNKKTSQHCPGGVGSMLGRKKTGSSSGGSGGTQTLSSLPHLHSEYSVKTLNKIPTLLEEYPELFPRGLYLDAQLGGLVTSLVRRGSPLNLILNPVRETEADAELHSGEAGEWKLMFHRECEFTDYLGKPDDEGYYSGTSHRVTVERVQEDLLDLSQKLGRLKTTKEKLTFKHQFLTGPGAFQTLTGVPRLFLPAVMYILDTLFGAIQAFETDPASPSFPWIQTLNQIVKYLDLNYRIVFDRLWPRRRGTGGGGQESDKMATGHTDEEEGDTAENQKKGKGKSNSSGRKSATKVKILTQTKINTTKWGFLIDNETGTRLMHPKGPLILSAQPDFKFHRQTEQASAADIRTSHFDPSQHHQNPANRLLESPLSKSQSNYLSAEIHNLIEASSNKKETVERSTTKRNKEEENSKKKRHNDEEKRKQGRRSLSRRRSRSRSYRDRHRSSYRDHRSRSRRRGDSRRRRHKSRSRSRRRHHRPRSEEKVRRKDYNKEKSQHRKDDKRREDSQQSTGTQHQQHQQPAQVPRDPGRGQSFPSAPRREPSQEKSTPSHDYSKSAGAGSDRTDRLEEELLDSSGASPHGGQHSDSDHSREGSTPVVTAGNRRSLSRTSFSPHRGSSSPGPGAKRKRTRTPCLLTTPGCSPRSSTRQPSRKRTTSQSSDDNSQKSSDSSQTSSHSSSSQTSHTSESSGVSGQSQKKKKKKKKKKRDSRRTSSESSDEETRPGSSRRLTSLSPTPTPTPRDSSRTMLTEGSRDPPPSIPLPLPAPGHETGLPPPPPTPSVSPDPRTGRIKPALGLPYTAAASPSSTQTTPETSPDLCKLTSESDTEMGEARSERLRISNNSISSGPVAVREPSMTSRVAPTVTTAPTTSTTTPSLRPESQEGTGPRLMEDKKLTMTSTSNTSNTSRVPPSPSSHQTPPVSGTAVMTSGHQSSSSLSPAPETVPTQPIIMTTPSVLAQPICSPLAILPSSSTNSGSISQGPGQTSAMMGMAAAADPGQQMMIWPQPGQGGQAQSAWTQPPPWAQFMPPPPLPSGSGPDGGPITAAQQQQAGTFWNPNMAANMTPANWAQVVAAWGAGPGAGTPQQVTTTPTVAAAPVPITGPAPEEDRTPPAPV